MKIQTAAERLIVAADFSAAMPEHDWSWVRRQLVSLIEPMTRSGVCIKVNSALRACGYSLLSEISLRGLRTFADLKLNDIPETMAADARLLAASEPDFVTVMCSAGIEGMHRVKRELPNTRVLGVTVLTSFTDEGARRVFGHTARAGVLNFARMAQEAGLDGLIASPLEIEYLRESLGQEWPNLKIVTPGIRPLWSQVANDDQKRTMTPGDAIRAGADGIVVGRPITQANDSRDAVLRTLEEIENALAAV